MRYEIGKSFECEVEQSKPSKKIDYFIPDEKKNLFDLHCLFNEKYYIEERIKRQE